MLSVALSGMVLICNFFEQTYFCHLHAYLPSYGIHLKVLEFQIYFHLDDYQLRKLSVSQEMMEQICHLETVELQEIPIKVCIMF